MATQITNLMTNISLTSTRRMAGWYEITNAVGDYIGRIRKYDNTGSKPWHLFTEGEPDFETFYTLKEAQQRALSKYVRAMERIEQESLLDKDGEPLETIYGVYPDSAAASIDPSMGFQLVPYGDNYHIVSNTGFTFGAIILDRRSEQYGDTYKVVLGWAVIGTACDPGLAARRVKAIVSDIPSTMSNALDVEFVDGLLVPDEDVSEGDSEDVSEDVPEGVSEDVPEGVSEDVPEDVSEDVPEDVSEDVPEDVATGSYVGKSFFIHPSTAKGDSEDVSEGVSGYQNPKTLIDGHGGIKVGEAVSLNESAAKSYGISGGTLIAIQQIDGIDDDDDPISPVAFVRDFNDGQIYQLDVRWLS